MSGFLIAYFLTLFIEGTVLFLLLRSRYRTTLIIRNAVVASSVTLPFVWFAFPLLGWGWFAQTAAAEIFAFLAEACIFRVLFAGLSWRGAVLAAFLCNVVSFLIGLALT